MSSTNILPAKSNKKNIFFTVILVAFFTVANSFAQKLSIDSASVLVTLHGNDYTVDETPTKATTTSVSNSNVNFILWFMGTKEDVNSTISSGAYSKKSFLTSGREPNHLLLKTLLKKAINTKSC